MSSATTTVAMPIRQPRRMDGRFTAAAAQAGICIRGIGGLGGIGGIGICEAGAW
jgi:hypothetical protein